MVFCVHIFLNMAVFWFDHCQIGVACSDYFSIFTNGRRKLVSARSLSIRVTTTDVVGLHLDSMSCIMQLPILKSAFENNQSVMGVFHLEYRRVFELAQMKVLKIPKHLIWIACETICHEKVFASYLFHVCLFQYTAYLCSKMQLFNF